MELSRDMAENNFNWVDFLQNELQSRIKKNSHYSLRSFSKSLNMSSSYLSKILNGKRAVTQKTIVKIANSLGMSPLNVVENTSAKFNKISVDQFQFISDWYHFAILELLSIAGFKSNYNYIAASLGIKPYQAKMAVDRLVRLGLIEKQVKKSGKIALKLIHANNTSIGPELVTRATRTQQESFLDMAKEAIGNIPIESRSQTSMTLAVPSSRIDEAKLMIRNFQRQFNETMQRPGERDAVYQLTISFFPISKSNKKKFREIKGPSNNKCSNFLRSGFLSNSRQEDEVLARGANTRTTNEVLDKKTKQKASSYYLTGPKGDSSIKSKNTKEKFK